MMLVNLYYHDYVEKFILHSTDVTLKITESLTA